jgi:DNA primase
MTYSQDFLDKIRQQLPLSQVIGLHVALHKQGNEWTGCSPFKAAKRNTLFVNDEKGFWHDFATDKHGDALAFVMDVEGLSDLAAVERLARIAGLPIPVS